LDAVGCSLAVVDTPEVAFVGVDTDALDSPEEEHAAAAEADILVDIGLAGQEGVLK